MVDNPNGIWEAAVCSELHAKPFDLAEAAGCSEMRLAWSPVRSFALFLS